ncbi:hypothetical protein [uncultured Chryseobacterium sp.]|uniref:hypothetical protein n=1 Tax=uncultured Chryseobacterium sp. TaxID=259322 RepID=UPI0025FB9113|nr:hypothetical protein [uncultured Chryseobacterium sp.]
MKKPVTYSDWVEIFERFASGDDTVLENMNSGNFDLDAGTAQRFYIKAEEAYKMRKKLWLERFQRSFETQNIKSADDFGMILLIGKKNLLPLSGFSQAKGLPEDLKTVFTKDLQDFANEIKKSLKDNIMKAGNEKEKMLLTINSFGLPADIRITTDEGADDREQNIPTKRKIIF